MKFYKNFINYHIVTILVYSLENIISYFTQKLKFINPFILPEKKVLGDFFNVKISQITFEQNDEDKFQSGCFELAETFDINLIKNKLAFRISDQIDYISEFSKNIYEIYKEHNSLDIFYSQNCLYLGWRFPDLIYDNFSFVKRFLYLYCREEIPSEKSLYRIINDELRSRDPYKIFRLINILALINDLIKEGLFSSFNGYVYRATKLDENLIMKLVPGTNMINTTFWSTSKDPNIAENFMAQNAFRNSYIICKTVKNNIDIELEKLNTYDEKEVLFLPFTEFRVEKVTTEIKYEKKIFTIELTDLGNRNAVNSDNMQIEDINDFGLKNQMEVVIKNKIPEIEGFNKLLNKLKLNQ